MHADRTNRVVLTLLSVLLIAAGVGGILGATGVFASGFQHRDLLANPVGDFVRTSLSWFWWAVAGVSLLVFLLCARWLWAVLFSTERIADFAVGRVVGVGGTTLQARALTGAVDAEVNAYRGVTRARTRVVGDPARPVLSLEVTIGESADAAELRDRIESGALRHARQAVGRDDLQARLDFTVTQERTSRVS